MSRPSLPFAPRALYSALMAIVALRGAAPLWSNDVFWHVALGRVYLEAGSLPAEDPLTYTAAGRPWVHHEWLSQVLLALADRAVGLGGLRYVRAALLVAVFALLWRLLRRPDVGVGPWPALLALSALWVFADPNVSLRPHLFSWVMAIVVFGWLAGRRSRHRADAWPWWDDAVLAVLVVLWANLHASAVIVPLLIGAHLAGALLARLWLGASSEPPARWAVSLAVAVAAVLAQPAGCGLIPYVLVTPEINVASGEWQPLLARSTWLGRPWLVVTWGGVSVAAAWLAWDAWRRRRAVPGLRTFPNAAVAVAVLYLAAAHRRMAFFVFLALLWCLRGLAARWSASPSWRARVAALDPRLARVGILAAGLSAITGVLWHAPDAFEPGAVRAGKFPEAATVVLGGVDLDGHLFATPNWGGYLSYHLYPRYRTFMDGRWIMAGADTLRDAGTIYTHRADDALLDRYGIAALLQGAEDYVRAAPLDARRWALAWQDRDAVLLLRRGEAIAANLPRWCAFYAARPTLTVHARWPLPSGTPAPNDGPFAPPSVLELCRADRAGEQPPGPSPRSGT